ncbi:MAG: omptin family outer membrane protease [Nitrospiraceae bacterium]|nr:MAG: omptin family outer membrane protease [Nitrospiraceae bacterium]
MKHLLCIIVCLSFINPTFLYADDYKPWFNVNMGAGFVYGNTTYQIGGDVLFSETETETIHFPLSELEFPIRAYMLTAGGAIQLTEDWSVKLNFQKSIASENGKMKDSDRGFWLLEYINNHGACPPPCPYTETSLDIYSESDAELDAFMFDINIRYTLPDKLNINEKAFLFAELGHTYQHLSYDVSNLNQWYPSHNDYFGYDRPLEEISGLVLKYRVTYYIPYIQIGLKSAVTARLGGEASIGYSPYVSVSDKDIHLVRVPVKTSYGDLHGQALMASLDLRYRFTHNWFTELNMKHMRINTSGTQDQYELDTFTATIDEKVKSHQTSAFINIGYAFP